MQGLDLKGTDVELSLLEVIIETGCFGNLSRVPLPIPNSCSASKDGAGRSAGFPSGGSPSNIAMSRRIGNRKSTKECRTGMKWGTIIPGTEAPPTHCATVWAIHICRSPRFSLGCTSYIGL